MENKMNKIGVIILLSIFSILFIGLFIYGIIMSNKETSEPVPTITTTTKTSGSRELLAIFHGGAGEVTYETLIYKIPNGHANMGFEYENRTCTTLSWGSMESDCNITKTGEVTWTDDVFPVAKANYAYSYVTVPGETKTYSINEFANRFLMD